MFHWLRDHNRSEARKRPFPDAWEAFVRANNEAEFFAAAAEEFFNRPVVLLAHVPDLYHVLSAYYCQDPAVRVNKSSLIYDEGSPTV